MFELNAMSTSTHLNAYFLGSYSILFGMDSLYLHRTKLDYYDKPIECLNENGEQRVL